MQKHLRIALMIWSTPLAMAQLDSNSVTVSAARSMEQQPDQVLFGVTVQSGFSTSLDDVVMALQGSGITTANFAGVNSQGFPAAWTMRSTGRSHCQGHSARSRIRSRP